VNDLDTATTEELWEALSARHETAALVVRGKPGDSGDLCLLMKGWRSDVIGMLRWAERRTYEVMETDDDG